MFHVSGVITVRSTLGIAQTGALVSSALRIPELRLDESGRFEELDVFVSTCFGLEFALCQPPELGPGVFELSIVPDGDAVEFGGAESEVDATEYALGLLRREPKLKVEAG